MSGDRPTLDSDAAVEICKFYDGSEGSCVRGVTCRFRHIARAFETERKEEKENVNAPQNETKGDDEEKEEEANGAIRENDAPEKGKDAVEEITSGIENVSIQQSGDKEAEDDEDDMELIE